MHIAVDLGAESGRVIAGDLNQQTVMHRFPSLSLSVNGQLHWDILGIFKEIKTGLKKCFSEYGDQIKSIGIDTWGVDYALLDENFELIGNPYHYRNERTLNIPEKLFEVINKERLYSQTGVQILAFNTIFQLYEEKLRHPERLKLAKHFLTIPDLLNFWLSGVLANEFTNATTTALLDPKTQNWHTKLIEELGLPVDIFEEIVAPGAILGSLSDDIREELGANADVKVIAPACHDTGSAVISTPISGNEKVAFLSSGTWSLLGAEVDQPIVTDEGYAANFTNEGSAEGKFRYLKNIMGLWVLQQCKIDWMNSGEDLDYSEIVRRAEASSYETFALDIDEECFLAPTIATNRMLDRITSVCNRLEKPAPVEVGDFAKLIFVGLANKYDENFKQLEKLIGTELDAIHLLGGGSQNEFLCQLTANATGKPVLAGPTEATALGNLVMQAVACNTIKDVQKGRQIVKEMNSIKTYYPVIA